MAEIELDLSIVATVKNRAHAINGLIRSILETADPVAFEMCVVTKKPESLPITLKDDFPNLVIKAADQTIEKGINQAIKAATGRYTMLVDHDVIVTPGCLKTLLDFMDDNPDVGVAGPAVLDAYGKTEPTAHAFPSLLALLGQTKIKNILPALWREGKSTKVGGQIKTPEKTNWLGGGVKIIRKELLDEIILPAKHFGNELAEATFCLMARKLGWHIFIVPQAKVEHHNPLRYKPSLAGNTSCCTSLTEVMIFLKRRWFS